MASQYFKNHKGFDRLFVLLKQKYISLNRFSGTVLLRNITEIESKDLTNFFGDHVPVGSDFKTSFSKIEKKLRETKFKDFTWEELFQNYFGDMIVTKEEAKKTFIKDEELFYRDILNTMPKQFRPWFSEILSSRSSLYQLFLKRYKKNKIMFKQELLNILLIMDEITKNIPTSLTMLSSLTSDPHFLDFGLSTSNLFFKLMANYYKKEEPKTSEQKIHFLSSFNIYVDQLSNFIILYNFKSDSDLINVFRRYKQPLNLNLSNFSTINYLDTDIKKVFVFENPSILPVLKKYDVPIIITYGNPNFIFYKVLEKLIESHNTIYYNGDFDPEGLLIAHNILDRFPETKLFCYKKMDYEDSISNNYIDESRLKKLNVINEPHLEEIVGLLRQYKKSAYQEKNIKNIEKYIKKLKTPN